MTEIDDIRAPIDRLAPAPICDDCISDRLGLSVRRHDNHKTGKLADSNGFEYCKDICSMCYGEKLLIRRPN